MTNEIGTDFKASSGAVLRDNADLRRLNTGSNEPIKVVMRNLFHQVQLLADGSRHLHVLFLEGLDGHQGALVRGHLREGHAR